MEDSQETTSLYRRIVRTELLYTVSALFLLVVSYGYLFLDDHLEWGVEYLLGRSIGAEVNIGNLRTGWIRPTLSLKELRVTDPKEPTRNLIDVGNIGITLNLDALLRMKILIEDASLDELRLGTTRDSPGWVREDGGDARWIYSKLLALVEDRFEESTDKTIYGNAEALLAGESMSSVLEAYSDNLTGLSRLEETRKKLSTAEARLDKELNRLPSKKEINTLREKIESLGGSSGSTSGKLKVLKEINKTVSQWKTDVRNFQSGVSDTLDALRESSGGIDSALEEDLGLLRSRLTLPEVNLGNPSNQLFQSFVAERGGVIGDLIRFYRQYLATVDSDQPGGKTSVKSAGRGGPAGSGRDYQFQTTWGYPDFWLREFRLSGGGNQTDSIKFSARINNVSTYAPATQGRSGLVFRVQQPVEGLEKLEGNVGRGRKGQDEVLRYQFTLEGLRINPWTLVSNDRATLVLEEGNLMLDFSGTLRDGTHTSLINFRMEEPVFTVDGSNELLTEALEQSVRGLDHVRLRGTGKGTPGSMNWRLRTNLGTAIEEGIRSFVRERAGQIKRDLIDGYQGKVENQREALGGRIQSLKSTYLEPVEEKANELDRIERDLKQTARETVESREADSLKKLLD